MPILALFFVCACARAETPPDDTAPRLLRYSVVRTLPHDVTHFTEGLLLHDGKLLESTGLYGQSALYESDLASGRVLRQRRLDARYFGEGIALSRRRIVQLSWREHTGWIYGLDFKPLGSFRYATEGWGLTTAADGRTLIMSDGSSRLRFLDGDSFRTLREITVRDRGREIDRLNELEYAGGYIYANVWTTDLIAVIDPADGHVAAWLDLAALEGRLVKPPDWNDNENVLNGIAYDARSGDFYVTGKCWPALFEIRIDNPLPQPSRSATPQ